jgi:DNA (cytosine-5)-methyltransferase 1
MGKTKLKFIDLFSGCGGFSKGLEMAGHKCLLGVDFNQDAVDSFAVNHPHAVAQCIDIHKLTKPKLQKLIDFNEVDMVIGGPPCQGFSTVGRGDVNDQRNSLFKQFVRIVRLTQPKVVLFENVTGMLAKKNQKILKAVFREFEKLGYCMDARVMSSEEYGVPSKRRRAIIMGVKDGIPSFPKVTHGERGSYKLQTVKDAFSSIQCVDGSIFNHEPELAQLKNKLDIKRLLRIPEGCGIRYEKDQKKYLTKSLYYDVNWETLREGRFRQTKLQRLSFNKPAPTILTSRTMYFHPVEPRYLTCREAASCQSFPNDFVFKGSQTSVFRQIGNAVPPMMARAIGMEVSKMIKTRSKRKKKSTHNNDFMKKAFTYSEKTYL